MRSRRGAKAPQQMRKQKMKALKDNHDRQARANDGKRRAMLRAYWSPEMVNRFSRATNASGQKPAEVIRAFAVEYIRHAAALDDQRVGRS